MEDEEDVVLGEVEEVEVGGGYGVVGFDCGFVGGSEVAA